MNNHESSFENAPDSGFTPPPKASAPLPTSPGIPGESFSAAPADNAGKPYFGPSPLRAPKATVPTTRRDIVFLVLTLFSSFLLMRLGFLGGMGTGFSLSYTFLLAVGIAYTHKKQEKAPLYYVALAVLCVVLSCSYFLTVDGVMKAFAFPCLMLLTFACLAGISGNIRCRDGSYMLLPDILESTVGAAFLKLPIPFRSLRAGAKSGKNKAFISVLIGLAVSLPLLLVIIPILASSDMAFEGLLQRMFIDFAVTAGSIFLSILFLPILFSCFFQLSKHTGRDANWNARSGKASEAAVNTVLTVISSAYLLYLFSQLAYIVKAFAFLLPKDYSASDFARRGFFEMAAIAAINFGVIAVCSIVVRHRENGTLPGFTKALLLFLIGFSAFYIVTAFLRMAQYISRFGLTRLRVLTSVFMLMLLLIFIVILIRLFVKRLPYMKLILMIAALTLTVVSIGDVNTRIAEYNLSAYRTGKITMDVDTLWELGAPAVPSLCVLADDTDEEVAITAQRALIDITMSQFNGGAVRAELPETVKTDEGFLAWNPVKTRAVEALNRFYASHPDFNSEAILEQYRLLFSDSEDRESYDEERAEAPEFETTTAPSSDFSQSESENTTAAPDTVVS